jgi:hypothetical protein
MSELAECFEYLDTLRESGVTNMFGAAPYLAEEYGLSNQMARDVHKKWMRTFSRNKTPAQRAAEALMGHVI